jgi:biotin-(acetyl-CoA carboxylase) ligase
LEAATGVGREIAAEQIRGRGRKVKARQWRSRRNDETALQLITSAMR